jgi:hypothetical protein
MILTISQYFSFNPNAGFLEFKQAVVGKKIWRIAFYTHVFSCFVCLFAGFTQFSKWILTRFPKVHKSAGRIYFFNIVLINFPVGLVLAVYANGNLPGKIAFILLDFLWLYFSIAGIYYIRKGEILKHSQFMIRSYAMTLTALSLRLCKFIMSKYSGWSYDSVYIFDAWTALTFNLLIGELIIYINIYRSNRKVIEIR